MNKLFWPEFTFPPINLWVIGPINDRTPFIDSISFTPTSPSDKKQYLYNNMYSITDYYSMRKSSG